MSSTVLASLTCPEATYKARLRVPERRYFSSNSPLKFQDKGFLLWGTKESNILSMRGHTEKSIIILPIATSFQLVARPVVVLVFSVVIVMLLILTADPLAWLIVFVGKGLGHGVVRMLMVVWIGCMISMPIISSDRSRGRGHSIDSWCFSSRVIRAHCVCNIVFYIYLEEYNMILPHHFWYQLMLFFSEQVELLSLCKSNQKLLLYTKSLKQVYFFSIRQ